jgi:hypothetical protein
MVNNSTNINKANNHLTQLSLNTQKTMTYYVGHLGPGLGHAHKSREGLGLNMTYITDTRIFVYLTLNKYYQQILTVVLLEIL